MWNQKAIHFKTTQNLKNPVSDCSEKLRDFEIRILIRSEILYNLDTYNPILCDSMPIVLKLYNRINDPIEIFQISKSENGSNARLLKILTLENRAGWHGIFWIQLWNLKKLLNIMVHPTCIFGTYFQSISDFLNGFRKS